jgi:hypothetical protein
MPISLPYPFRCYFNAIRNPRKFLEVHLITLRSSLTASVLIAILFGKSDEIHWRVMSPAGSMPISFRPVHPDAPETLADLISDP